MLKVQSFAEILYILVSKTLHFNVYFELLAIGVCVISYYLLASQVIICTPLLLTQENNVLKRIKF